MAKKKKKIVRREYTKADVKELRAHSKAKTPLAKIMKLTKRFPRRERQRIGAQPASTSRDDVDPLFWERLPD